MNPLHSLARTEQIAMAVDTLTAEAQAAARAGIGAGDAIAFGAKLATIRRFRELLIPEITPGSPSRPVHQSDADSAARGLGLRAMNDAALDEVLAAHGDRLAFASQAITQAVRDEQHRRSVLRAE